MHAIWPVRPHNESQNYIFYNKGVLPHKTAPFKTPSPSHTFISSIIFKFKTIYIYAYILCKNVHKASSDQSIGGPRHISVGVCMFHIKCMHRYRWILNLEMILLKNVWDGEGVFNGVVLCGNTPLQLL